MSDSPQPTAHPGPGSSKDAWRRWALHRRRARSDPEICTARDRITGLLTTLSTLSIGETATTICSYLPLRTEPLAVAASDGLVALGHRVLLPVTRAAVDGIHQPLGWAEHRPGRAAVSGVGGVPDPGAPLAPHDERRALADVTLVLVPALLVTPAGVRLGRGGGHYDRSFAFTDLGRAAQRAAVVFDDELVQELPADAHDVRMTHLISPCTGVVPTTG